MRLEVSSRYFCGRDSRLVEANFCYRLKRMYFKSSESFSDDLCESWVFNSTHVLTEFILIYFVLIFFLKS